MNDELKHHIERLAAELAPKIRAHRQYLHANPELSWHEFKTAAWVAARLSELGLTPKTLVGGRGVTAVIEGTGARVGEGASASASTSAGKTVGLRADMDALPIQEAGQPAYKSTVQGVMHACGHDGHTANLLGTAELLLAIRSSFAGRVKLVFQPAEEKGGGAAHMIAEGALENPRVDAMFGFHGWPHVPVGQVGIRSGPMMAASDSFTITVTGKGGHAAAPHNSLNPVSALVRLAADLEAIPATRIPATDAAVLTVTNIHAGQGASNVIPDDGRISGTYRTHRAAIRTQVGAEIQQCAARYRALGYEIVVELKQGYPVVINAPALEPIVRRALTAQLGAAAILELPAPSMGGEDFAYYGELIPAYFMRLGVAPNPSLHNPKFNFNDDALPSGMAAFARIAIEYLADPL